MTSIVKKNDVYLRIGTEQHIHHELSEYFTFEVPEAKFLQQQRRYRRWDGKIRLYSPGTGELYVGLYHYLVEWLEKMGYEYTIEDNQQFGKPGDTDAEVTPQTIARFVRSLAMPIKARDYQLKAIYSALRRYRRLILSPTGSGKSLIIYCLMRWYIQRNLEVLIIVPTTSLVEQLYKDFQSYGFYCQGTVDQIYGGKEKYTKAQVIISTWQSIYKEDKSYFKRFDAVIGDEAHLYKAKSLTSILNKCHNANFRVGLTGTLDGLQCNQLVLEGLFGPVERSTEVFVSIRVKDQHSSL